MRFVSMFVSILMLIVLIGCGEDEENWVGKWRLHTIDDETVEQVLNVSAQTEVEVKKNEWEFHDNDTWDSEFEAETKLESVAVQQTRDIKLTLKGSYTLSGSDYTLIISNVTQQQQVLFSQSRNTGTWERSGSTLTLNNDDDRVITFKIDD